jgi:signal transduction histidine kinase
VILTLVLGLYVRQAVAPRIKRLVAQVHRFRESGTFERMVDHGKDDIAVLAHALDAGFSSIATRERDREQFLAVAGHELKTPITSIHGYASLLISHPPPATDLNRALAAISRQSTRLSRLIDTLLLAVKARPGKLRFEPKPFDLSELVERVLREIQPLLLKKTFLPQIQENISILGDEALLEHALWSLFACASSLSAEDAPLHVAFYSVDHTASLAIDIKVKGVSLPELQEIFTPFQVVEYESGGGIRSSVGLYLCREIVRIHNGSLRVQESDLWPEFLMELPM